MIHIENRQCYKCAKPFQIYAFPLEEAEGGHSTCCGNKTTIRKKELITAQCHDCGITHKGYSIDEINMVIRHNRLIHLSKQLPLEIEKIKADYKEAVEYQIKRKQQVGEYLENTSGTLAPRTMQEPDHYRDLEFRFTKKLEEVKAELATLR